MPISEPFYVSDLRFLNQNWSKTLRYTKIKISRLVFGVWSSYLNLERLGRFSLECAIFYWSETDSRERKPGSANWWATGEHWWATSWLWKIVELRKSEHMPQRFIMSLDSPESMAPYLQRMLPTKVLRRDSFTKWAGPLTVPKRISVPISRIN